VGHFWNSARESSTRPVVHPPDARIDAGSTSTRPSTIHKHEPIYGNIDEMKPREKKIPTWILWSWHSHVLHQLAYPFSWPWWAKYWNEWTNRGPAAAERWRIGCGARVRTLGGWKWVRARPQPTPNQKGDELAMALAPEFRRSITCPPALRSSCCSAQSRNRATDLRIASPDQNTDGAHIRSCRASPRVCQNLLDKSCVLPTSKKLCKVKKRIHLQ
jgi:hypothetical protein